MMFSPFLGEVILGKILSTTPQWIRGKLVAAASKLTLVSLGFFQDIYIPPSLLPDNSA